MKRKTGKNEMNEILKEYVEYEKQQLSHLSDRSLVKHIKLNTDLYKDEFNNIFYKFPAYDVVVDCYNKKRITEKQKAALITAYAILKYEKFNRRF